jgi:hypothetical protein
VHHRESAGNVLCLVRLQVTDQVPVHLQVCRGVLFRQRFLDAILTNLDHTDRCSRMDELKWMTLGNGHNTNSGAHSLLSLNAGDLFLDSSQVGTQSRKIHNL